ncbi:anthocyanidin 3-O-glucosyltransferase 5-like [Argentina anserina]|uniref:anthocyanidin 3-O-glucosyltransferase 5-like n=1 Tax=Argentina anserina TaxID=57926 RepID=UPI0021763C6C|nr:anthocyanidin 3-O-glucosyltransferase 5-like [Potentilla anserina]
MSSSNSTLHVAILSSPGFGHIIPVLELGKRLIASNQNIRVTIFALSSTSQAESLTIKEATTAKLNVVTLPPVDISGLVDPKAAVVTCLAVIMREIRPAFRSALHDMACPPTMLIVDTFGTESLLIGEELGIPKYVYIPSNAWFLALMTYSPTLDKEVEGEYVLRTEPLKIPGCRTVVPEEVIDPMLDRTNQQYSEYIRFSAEISLGDGILLNIWEELQPTTLAAFRDEKLLGRVTKMVPVYPVGPLTRLVQSGDMTVNKDLFDWLDKQPSESVIFVCLGSGGTLSNEQMMEMAWGLELSQQRFIWVVRPPTTKSDAAFFTAGNGVGDVSTYFPEGFLTRTSGMGFIVPLWAPQVDILSHLSVGGFFSHCGWNSTLESVKNGVPMIAWPLYAEQRMNATLLTEELGVAVRSEVPPWKKVVGREEIERMVRKIMVENDGFKIRGRAKELKRSGERALREGGSSYNALSQVVSKTVQDMKIWRMNYHANENA